MNDIKTLLNKLKSVAARYGFYSVNNDISSVESLLSEESLINVVILGQFKSGKSSFINSLIGFDLLPTGVIPVTSTIIMIEYGDNDEVAVENLNGQTFIVNFEDIEDYVSEAKNPLNVKQVKSITIKSSLIHQYDGLRIIDTPGLDSVLKYTTETTKNFLTNVGVAIIAISSERPLSESDLELIEQVSKYTPHIIILLTKVDLFTASHLNEIILYINEALNQKFTREFKLYPYSVFKETEKFRNTIEIEVFNTLLDKYDYEIRKIAEHKLEFLKQNCLAYLDAVYKSSLKTENERELARMNIIDEKMNLNLIKKELNLITDSYINSTRNTLNLLFENHKDKITKQLQTALEKEFGLWTGNLHKITAFYSGWIKNKLTELLSIMIAEEDKYIKDILYKAKIHFERYLESFKSRLNSSIAKELGVIIPESKITLEDRKILKPDISVTRVFDIPLDMIWFLFPMFLFKRVFKSHFLKQIANDTEKNIYRLVSDLTERINKEINAMKNESYRYINSEISTIESMFTNSVAESAGIFSEIESINLLTAKNK